MSGVVVRQFGSLQSELAAVEFGAHFSVRGQVSSESVGVLMQAVLSDLTPMAPKAVVCDYRGADMGATARSLVHAQRRSGQSADWPTALIIQPDQAELWRLYRDIQARHGHLKGVFTEPEEAYRWAADMAALRAAQERFNRRRG